MSDSPVEEHKSEPVKGSVEFVEDFDEDDNIIPSKPKSNKSKKIQDDDNDDLFGDEDFPSSRKGEDFDEVDLDADFGPEDEDEDAPADEDEEEAEEDDDEEDDDDDEDDGEEKISFEEIVRKDKKRKRKDKKKDKLSKKMKKAIASRFFGDEAEVADEEESEEDGEDEPEAKEFNKDYHRVVEAISRRQEKEREMQNLSAEEIAARYENQHLYQRELEKHYNTHDQSHLHYATAVSQQELLPSIKDPKIFKLKCKPGNEMIAIRSILLKSLDVYSTCGIYKVKSAFCGSTKGYVYVEAISEAFAKEILDGLRMVYSNSFSQLPIDAMTSVLNVTVKKQPLKPGQFVRLRRGPLKGDLARIVSLHEGGEKAFIQAVPRPVYTQETTSKDDKKKSFRPPQALFDPVLARANGGSVLRRHHDLDIAGAPFDLWGNEYYRNGFLFKEVKTATFLDDRDVKPKLDELLLFSLKKQAKSMYDDEEDNGADDQLLSTFNQELQSKISELETTESNSLNSFTVGDLIKVLRGDLTNLIGRISNINTDSRTATIIPLDSSLSNELEVELDIIIKYIALGSHVKIMSGHFIGQTGRVVAIRDDNELQTAIILTDGLNNEIQCNVSFLKLSDEIAVGKAELMGYELYDLVMLNENETGVVISVAADSLKIINHLGIIKDVSPQELRGKQNHISRRSKAFDAHQNTLSNGDLVNIINGPCRGQNGTIKHINRGKIWCHTTTQIKNNGIFVVNARDCALAGAEAIPNPMAPPRALGGGNQSNSGGRSSVHSTPSSIASSTPNGGNRPGKRNSMIGQTVVVTKGAYKSLMGRIIDSTSSHYSIELLAKMKKVVIPHSDIMIPNTAKPIETQASAMTAANYNSYIAPSTPFLSAQTPVHMMGSETPRFTAETPRSGGYDDDDFEGAWKITADEIRQENRDELVRTNTPASSEFNYTPKAITQTPLHPSATPHNDELDLAPGMVVLVKKGEYLGKIFVVMSINQGVTSLKLRLGTGELGPNEISVPSEDVVRAIPPKKAKVTVIRGPMQGKSGFVQQVAGKDFIVDISGDKTHIIKQSSLAWIHA